MRHKYATPAIVLGRLPLAEASASITLLTAEVGLIRARAQGVRKPGAKMASALQTFTESEVLLLRGKDGWRLAGALQGEDWFKKLGEHTARRRAGRIAALLQRLVQNDSLDTSTTFYSIFSKFLFALTEITTGETSDGEKEALADAAECLAALRILHALGVDAGEIPDGLLGEYPPEVLEEVIAHRQDFITRINRGIGASGL
jgi:recombinational DNA repair protein (RecF pathway)